MAAYRDNPFDSRNNSHADLQDYYDSVPPAHRLSGNNIPLTPAGAQQTPYQQLNVPRNDPFSADSTDDLTTPTAPNRSFADSYANTGPGAAMMSERGRYADESSAPASFVSREPRLGVYGRRDENGDWVQPQRQKSNRRKWVVMGVGLAVVGIIIIIAVVLGIVLSKKSGEKSSSSSPSSGSTANGAVTQTNPSDPSTFVKDPNLHQSFYGIAYTPVGSQLPDCGNSLAAVIEDIQILSQLTKRIRLYGADCNQTALVLEAIKQTKVDMTVWVGNYPIATDNGAAYQRQRDILKAAIQTYGTDHIGGVTVGNEFMLNYVTDAGVQDPNSAIANTGAQMLISFIQDTRNMLSGMSVNLPVGNSDAGSYFNNQVLQAVDYGLANVHPWFANQSASAAAGWTADFFQQNDVELAQSMSNKPTMYIAETGWPTKSSDAGNANNGASPASIPNLQLFLNDFVCQANTNGTRYFFFEFCDEDWKDKQFGGVEGWWGIFNQDRTLKSGITIPNCTAP